MRDNRLLNKQKNRRNGACRRCTTATRWVPRKILEDKRLKLNEKLVELQNAQMNLDQFIVQNMENDDRMERGMQMADIERDETLELPSSSDLRRRTVDARWQRRPKLAGITRRSVDERKKQRRLRQRGNDRRKLIGKSLESGFRPRC